MFMIYYIFFAIIDIVISNTIFIYKLLFTLLLRLIHRLFTPRRYDND